MSETRRNAGRMAPYIEGLQAELLEQRYTPGTVRNQLKVVGQLGRWMDQEDVRVEALSPEVIDAFLAAKRADGRRRVEGVRSFRPFLEYLHGQGVVRLSDAPSGLLEEFIASYRAWLIVERGLAAPTILRYENLARRFLRERMVSFGHLALEDLVAPDVTGFLLRECGRVSVGAAKGRVAELRSLLRFLYLRGWTPKALATAVPPVAGWHDTGVPVGVTADEVRLLLDSCDRGSSGGIRDLAILSLVARLGLRSAEVARLELGDIDWRAGEVEIRGKARRRDRLPLPYEVGEALADYLHQARPGCPAVIREVFLAEKAPLRAIRPDLVGDVTRRACDRVGLPRVGAHRLRHALATDLLGRGATLVAVSQVLRHRDLATTAVYAKVDLGGLRQVAQPWPGVKR